MTCTRSLDTPSLYVVPMSSGDATELVENPITVTEQRCMREAIINLLEKTRFATCDEGHIVFITPISCEQHKQTRQLIRRGSGKNPAGQPLSEKSSQALLAVLQRLNYRNLFLVVQ